MGSEGDVRKVSGSGLTQPATYAYANGGIDNQNGTQLTAETLADGSTLTSYTHSYDAYGKD